MEFVLNDKQAVYDVVSDELSLLGISPMKLGYTYLIEAVAYVLEDEENLHGITKSVYPYLAQTFSTTAEAVERAIRTAISAACASGEESIRLMGDNKRNKLHFTNKEFIFKTVKTLKRRLETVNIDKY